MKIVIPALVMLALPTVAELEWKQKEIVLQVHPTQTAAEAVFEFENGGDEPVAVRDVRISCGCLSTKLLKGHYAPGEQGQLVVQFNLNNRSGKQRKHVVVETDDGRHVDLTIAADIPIAYDIETKLLQWKKGDNATEKTVHLRNAGTTPVKLFTASSSHPGMPARLVMIREGFEYELVVARNTDKPNIRAVIRIATEPPPGMEESKTLKLYAVSM